MPRVFGAMQGDEETLDVAIQTTLPHLVGVDVNEGVVSALGPDRESKPAERSDERALAGSRSSWREPKGRKELVRRSDNVRRGELTPIEMSHFAREESGGGRLPKLLSRSPRT